MRGVEGEFDVGTGGGGNLGECLPGDRGEVLLVAALERRDPVATDEVLIAGSDLDRASGLAGRGVDPRVVDDGHRVPPAQIGGRLQSTTVIARKHP